ncbi:MAG: flagellar hook-length control protein FliK [Deltaproteobacteria bacterium]|jgi:hypothetical protein|nr:flagellar hook-length control protein FliK [Deltaproteobacteria bacterium]
MADNLLTTVQNAADQIASSASLYSKETRLRAERSERSEAEEFDDYLAKAERTRTEEANKTREARGEKKAAEAGASRKEKRAEASENRKAAEETEEVEESDDDDGTSGAYVENPVALADNPFALKADRVRGAGLAYVRTQSEITLSRGFKAKVSRELLLSGNFENVRNGVSLGKGNPMAILRETLEGVDTNLNLFSLDKEAVPALKNIMTSSGADAETVDELMEGLAAEGGLSVQNVMLALFKGQSSLGPGAGSGSGLAATEEGLNNLGQFLLGLGLSLETVKAVTTGTAPGSLLPASTLRGLITSVEGGEEALSGLIGEGELNFLALALQSMARGTETVNGVNLLLSSNPGNVTLGDLLTFLDSVAQNEMVPSTLETAKDIQTILSKIQNDQELVKAPVFNEAMLKLSLLGDREIDRDFFELSPALQALKGGISGRGAGTGEFDGNGKDERREREERRLLSLASAANGNAKSAAIRGGFSGILGDEAAAQTSGETLGSRVREKLVYSARKGIRKLRMSLSPESLGGLEIELRVRGNSLTANIRAETLEAYEALEKEANALKKSLALEGLELKLTLTHGDGGSYMAGNGERHSLGNGNARGDLSGNGTDDSPGNSGDGEEFSPDDEFPVREAVLEFGLNAVV